MFHLACAVGACWRDEVPTIRRAEPEVDTGAVVVLDDQPGLDVTGGRHCKSLAAYVVRDHDAPASPARPRPAHRRPHRRAGFLEILERGGRQAVKGVLRHQGHHRRDR